MLEIRNLCKTYYPKKGSPVKALNNVSIKFEEKGMVFILGKSGSGKSTLLNMLGGLDKYDSGELLVKGKSSKDFSQADFDSYRNTYVGFIFQEYNILEEFSIGKNIGLALELQNKKAGEKEITSILEQVDLVGYANRKPAELSGGQKQRVAIARALIKNPEIILADEPTGALDSNTGKQIFETLQKLSKEKLVIIVSHDREYAEYYGDRVIEFKDGEVISDIYKYTSESNAISKGVSIIDKSILHVKKGHKLSEKEKSEIISFLDSKNSDLILSKDERSNVEFKRVNKIDEDGNKESFTKTTEEMLNLKPSDGNDFKLVKGRLPYRHSLKMGASSLKVKPFRLLLTILLAAVAIAFFGVTDTLGSYNKYEAAYSSIRDLNIDYAALSKVEREKIEEDYYRENNARFSEENIEYIKEQFPNNDFYKGYSFGYSFGENLYNANNQAYGSYYSTNFYNCMEATSELMDYFGFKYKGTLPTKYDEIAISSYVYESFAHYGLLNRDTGQKINVTKEEDIIGKTFDFGPYDFKITAVIDTGFNGSRYEKLKDLTNSSFDFSLYQLVSELDSIKEFSYHASAFMSNAYIKELTEPIRLNTFSRNLLVSSGNYYLYTIGKYSDATNTFFFDKNKTSLDSGEILITPAYLQDICYGFLSEDYNYHDSIVTALETPLLTYCTNLFVADPTLPSKLKPIYKEGYIRLGYSVEYAETLATDNSILPAVYKDYLVDKYFNENSFYNENPLGEGYKTGFEVLLELTKSNHALVLNALPSRIINYNLRLDIYDQYSYGDGEHIEFKIVGLDLSINDDEPGGTFNDIEYKNSFPLDTVNFILSKMPTAKEEVLKFVRFGETADANDENSYYYLKNQVTTSLEQINGTIENLSSVFLYIGIAFAVFSALLLFNFITTSINYKRREIGILRAVGAKPGDVFGIFFNESAIIAFISLFIALVGTIVANYFLNQMVRDQLGIIVTLLNFGLRQLGLMFVVAIGTAFIASFLPVYRIAKKKPVDAIKNL